MSTTPAPTLPSWVTLLITLGANLGSAFVGKYATLLTTAAATTTDIIQQIQAAKAAGTATASNLVVPIFTDSILTALSAGVAAGKIPAADAAELSKAVAAMAQEDLIAKTTVDYTTIPATIAPVS